MYNSLIEFAFSKRRKPRKSTVKGHIFSGAVRGASINGSLGVLAGLAQKEGIHGAALRGLNAGARGGILGGAIGAGIYSGRKLSRKLRK